ncbi:MAG: hypothetical protein LC734_01345 [Acidobacteria bacterium]|nr:hypothetical protein [Acidobacteriota bacterium]
MARVLTLSLDGQQFPVSLAKIDREALYGAVDIEAFDEKGKPASIKVLAADGKTLIDKGGTALTTIDESGTSTSRSGLTAVDENGDPISRVESSFNYPNVLNGAKADDYLSQIVKTVYVLSPPDGESLDFLLDHLADGQLYNFPFSYRGGLDYDNAFVVGSRSDAFMVVGRPAALKFVSLNQATVLDAVEETEISADDIDFDLL